ncbi:MAG: hypothetical protein Q7J76_04390 [Candidatus Brocadiaceae bacterium]|uniref:hypothetical protein n=1 Tax=Candidatus Wunengus sp. YC61 TaxID=3367698 RepID=UPI00271D0FED|nr:hypothetical protein [Candidatus Brocadiaceae bacterium]
MGRRLIYIPIIHTEVDMGSLAESLKKEYIKKYGIHKWEQHLKKINDLWTGIEERLNQRNLRYNQVKVYQDGLPVCGKELEIVQAIANSGGKNHQLLLKLIHEGATLMGTEDPSLLIKEYQLIKNAAARKGAEKGTDGRSDYLVERDVFIANRIDTTLKDGETGILFLGMLHKADEKLPSDVVIDYLIYHLPFKEAVSKKKNL